MRPHSYKSYTEKAIKIHNNKYNYEFVEYKNNKTKIKIICPKHGEFFQRADVHLCGQGCKMCHNEKMAIENLMTQEQFLSKANKIHGNKYDYRLSVYKNNKTKIKIICPIHGEFLQQPNNHFICNGCSKCSFEKITLSQEQFLSKANKIHGNKYDYRLSVYKNNKTKIKIICTKHGVFLQTPSMHINGMHGCPKCGGTCKLTQNEFIAAAKKKHNNRYDYNFVLYVNNPTKVKIICKLHGEFLQRPNRHLQGDGCPKCNMSKGETKIKDYLDKNNLCYEQQFTFDSCASKRKLPFDFWVKFKNIIYLIEYQGQQHYELVNFSKNPLRTKTKFEQTQHHDKIKQKWCQDNNVTLIIIPYLEETKIDQILSNHFNT